MMALLVIAHPDDDKFKKWIVRKLQIDRMLRDRESINVSEGFWKGLRTNKIREVFSQEEERTAELDLLVDYSGLFGSHFISAKQDISSFLSELAPAPDTGPAEGEIECHGSTSGDSPASDSPGDPADENEWSHDGSGADGRASRDRCNSIDRLDVNKTSIFPLKDIMALRKCLEPTDVQAAEVEQWLCEKVAAVHPDANHPLVLWCRHWHLRMKDAAHYRDQIVIRSIFQQISHTLYLLEAAQIPSVNLVARKRDGDIMPDESGSWPLACCYALLDIKDGTSRHRVADHLRRFPAGRAWCETIEQARGLMSGRKEDQLEAGYQAQLAALLHITKESPFHDYLFALVAFDALRILAVIHDRQERPCAEPVLQEENLWLRRIDDLLGPEEATQLKLTRWQRQAILLSRNGNGVLTRWQDVLYRSKICPDGLLSDGEDVASLSALECMPVDPPANLTSFQLNKEVRDALVMLLGDARKPATVPNILPDLQLTRTQAVQSQAAETQHGCVDILPRASKAPVQRPAIEPTNTLKHATSLTRACGPASIGPAKSYSSAPTSGEANEATTQDATSPLRHVESPQHGLRAQSTYESETNINPGRNAFSGYFISPPKRSASPIDSRLSKLPKLGIRTDLDSLRREMAEDLKTQLSIQSRRLREEVDQDIKVSRERLFEAFQESLQAHLGALTTNMVVLKSQLTPLATKVESLATQVENMATKFGVWKVDTEKVQAGLVASQEDHAKRFEGRIKDLHDDVKAGTEELRHMEANLGNYNKDEF